MMHTKTSLVIKMDERLNHNNRNTSGRTLHPLSQTGSVIRKTVTKQDKNYDQLIRLPRLSFGKKLRLFFSRYLIGLGGLAIISHILLGLFSLVMGLMLTVVNPPFTSLMIHRIINYDFKPKPVQFIPLKKISPSVRNLMVRLEDQDFYSHIGIDVEALQYAYKLNKAYKRTIAGGSTITMQLTRTLFLNFDKNYIRKYVEVIIAVILDAVMDKKRILELYFNYIEWGKGVYGIGAASLYHYHKAFSKLDFDQICRLLTIVSSPVKYNVNTFVRNKTMMIRYNFLTGGSSLNSDSGETENANTNSTETASTSTSSDVNASVGTSTNANANANTNTNTNTNTSSDATTKTNSNTNVSPPSGSTAHSSSDSAGSSP